MKLFFSSFFLLIFSFSAFSQSVFNLKNSSKEFDIKIWVEDCGDLDCEGKAVFSFYKKGKRKPFQVIKIAHSYMEIVDREDLSVGEFQLAEESAIAVGDFNFDGKDDIAINREIKGMPWYYKVYLASKNGKFVYNEGFSQLNQRGKGFWQFEIDKKKKVLRFFVSDYCCENFTEEYAVINNRPIKVFVEKSEYENYDTKKLKITTKKLIKGKWETKIEHKTYEK